MNQKKIVTNIVAITLAVPALADPVSPNIAVGTNPADCNESVLETTVGSVDLEANWTLTQIQCLEGQYLNTSTAQCVSCTANNYCPGGTYNVESDYVGLNTCPTGFANSTAGSVSNTECYRTCATTDIANSTSVSGSYYYGDTNHCIATACQQGFHLQETRLYTNTTIGDASLSRYFAHNQYGCNGGVNGHNITSDAYDTADCSINEEMKHFAETTDNNTWRIYFDNSAIESIEGIATCATTIPSDGGQEWDNSWVYPGSFNPLSETGNYCWGKITKINGQQVSSYWIGAQSLVTTERCEKQCVIFIRNVIFYQNWQNYQRDALHSLYTKSCDANVLNIDWNPGNGESHVTNQCTYNGGITVPSVPQRTGYTFNGWRVVQQNQ